MAEAGRMKWTANGLSRAICTNKRNCSTPGSVHPTNTDDDDYDDDDDEGSDDDDDEKRQCYVNGCSNLPLLILTRRVTLRVIFA